MRLISYRIYYKLYVILDNYNKGEKIDNKLYLLIKIIFTRKRKKLFIIKN